MKRKLFVIAVLIGICAFNFVDRPSAASQPVCGQGACAGQPDASCTCPPGTKLAGSTQDCGTWHADCNLL